MFKKLFSHVFEYREKLFILCRRRRNNPFIKREESISYFIKYKNINSNEEIIDKKKRDFLNIHLYLIRGRGFVTVDKCIESNKNITFQEINNGNNKKDTNLNKANELNSIEKILDETNSMIYVNEICLKMDQAIMKCQNYEDILSILITHRGALFLQNLITAIRMLSGFVIEEKKKRKEKELLNLSNEYTKYVNVEKLKVENYCKNEEKEQNIDNINIIDTESKSAKLEEKNNFNNNSIINNSDIKSCESNNDTIIDKIEKNLIEKYKNIFDVLNEKKLLESENNFQKNRKIEEIIVLDERYNLLIEDIYKNRKYFDVISVCHILISLKELNHKHFLLFNSFMNTLKMFDIYIKEQFENNQKISYINSTMQLLLECFNTYIWAGYYSLDIYNKLINSILLNKFIHLNEELLYAHYDQLNKYTYMDYKYNVNYPISIEEVLKFFNINKKFYMNFFSKNSGVSSCISQLGEYEENNKNKDMHLNDIDQKEIQENFSEEKNDLIKNENNLIKKEKTDNYINENKFHIKSEISGLVCPIFLNLELFLKSLEIYKNIYVYNPDFFKISEKVVYYYTPYLSPYNLSMIASAFSKHRIFTIEHDRIFFHISKILENNFEKFSYEDIFHILGAFKKMNLLFEKSIILSAKKFKEYFHYLYINRKESVLSLKDTSILMESLTFFNFTHKSIDECIIAALNYLEDYIDDIDEETSINVSYALVLSNLFHVNTYFFSFIWRKIGKTTYWEKRKSQIFLLWLSHMIQFKWMDFDLPKFCVLESLKVFYLKRKENMFYFSKIISHISKILEEMQINHEISVDIYCPYVLDILIKKKRQVIMLAQDTTRNEVNRELGDCKIISNHLKLYGYNVKYVNIKYFDSLDDENKREYIKNILI